MIIGIGGVSRSGKTSLAFLIKDIFDEIGESATVLSQDNFIMPESEIPKIRHRIDWERPESINFEAYKKDILEKKEAYQHVITEGLFNFNDDGLIALFDYNFFVQISESTFLKRKAEDKRWGYEPKWFVEHIWKSYQEYGRVVLENPFIDALILSGEKPISKEFIEAFLGLR
jgi:nicotinamide/nicotinate riboside kinase